MYGAIPDVVITKPPRNNQFRVVVALVVGVMIGALGTAMLFPVATKLTPAPTPAPPGPILAATENEKCRNTLSEMSQYGAYCTQERMNIIYERCLPGVKALPCRPEHS